MDGLADCEIKGSCLQSACLPLSPFPNLSTPFSSSLLRCSKRAGVVTALMQPSPSLHLSPGVNGFTDRLDDL